MKVMLDINGVVKELNIDLERFEIWKITNLKKSEVSDISNVQPQDHNKAVNS